MNVRSNEHTLSKRGCIIIIVSALFVLSCFTLYSFLSFNSLMSIEVIQYDNCTKSQIDYFLEYCGLDSLAIERVDYLVVSESPHKSDSRMYIVFNGDVTDWWDEFINNPSPEDSSLKLPGEHTFKYDAMKQINPFVRVYRLAINDAGKSLLIVTNVSATTMNQLAELCSD